MERLHRLLVVRADWPGHCGDRGQADGPQPREGEEQLSQYVAEIARDQPFVPFGFMANGLHTYFWDVGQEHPRMVAGFFAPEDLERLRFIRENHTPLIEAPIKNSIVDRGIPARGDSPRRRRLHGRTNAAHCWSWRPGTGKTRTTMGLIDVFMRSAWAQRVLVPRGP